MEKELNITDLAVIGGLIAERGLKLEELRNQREELNKKIAELEGEILPLVTQHTALIAKITGRQITSIASAPMPPQPGFGMPMAPQAPSGEESIDPVVKNRVKMFLSRVDSSVSASEVAEALRLDAGLVREVLRELATERTGP